MPYSARNICIALINNTFPQLRLGSLKPLAETPVMSNQGARKCHMLHILWRICKYIFGGNGSGILAPEIQTRNLDFENICQFDLFKII